MVYPDYPSLFPTLYWDYLITPAIPMVYQDERVQFSMLYWDFLITTSNSMVYPDERVQFSMLYWDFLITKSNPMVYLDIVLIVFQDDSPYFSHSCMDFDKTFIHLEL